MLATTTRTISDVFAADHDRLDALFAAFRRLKWSDYPAAKDCFRQFKFGLQRHIVWEEQILFAAFEKLTGLTDAGPTAAMRIEHRQIGQCLEALHDRVRRADPASDGEEAALLAALGAHNEKEESVLYPTLDQLLGEAERAEVFDAMERVPESAYASCCGHHHG